MIFKSGEIKQIKGNANVNRLFLSADDLKIIVSIDQKINNSEDLELIITYCIDSYSIIESKLEAEYCGELKSIITYDGEGVSKDKDDIFYHIKIGLLKAALIAGGNNIEFQNKAFLAADIQTTSDNVLFDLINLDFYADR